jgi:uncharacterized protein (TIGR03086 family)
MSTPPDLETAARRMVALLQATPAGALDWPTPCEYYAVGDLLDHVRGAALAFTAAARKTPTEVAPSGDGADLPADWRTQLQRDVLDLAEAWRSPGAWEGTTRAGGVDLPADVAGIVALDEVVIHGWDLARAIGAPASYAGPGLEAVHETVRHFRSQGIDGLFGPEVAVPNDAPLFDRVLGLSGRDPGWQPPRSGGGLAA